MQALLAASVQLCVDERGFVIFGEKRRAQKICRDVVPGLESGFGVHIFADADEDVAELESVVPEDAEVRVYTAGNISLSDGLGTQQLTLAATSAVDGLARHLRANQAMNRLGVNRTTYQTDTYSI